MQLANPRWGYNDNDTDDIDANEELTEKDDIDAYKRYKETLKVIEKGEE